MKTSRRKLIRNALGMTAGAAAVTPVAADDRIQRFILKKKGGVRKGRINQSVVSWCFAEYWSTDKMCRVAKDLGCKSIELISPDEFPTLKKHGLTCAITPIDMGGLLLYRAGTTQNTTRKWVPLPARPSMQPPS